MSSKTLADGIVDQILYALSSTDYIGQPKYELLEFIKSRPNFERLKQKQLEIGLDRALKIIQNSKKNELSEDVAEKTLMKDKSLNRGNSINQSIVNSWNFNSNKPELEAVYNSNKRKEFASKDIDMKKSKSKSSSLNIEKPFENHLEINFSSIGGIDECINEILELVIMPLKHPEIYCHMGVHPPRGILLYGPPGCGKTLLANAVAGEAKVPFISISAPSLVAGMSGESEKNVRDIFEKAKQSAPCILFFDEIDVVTPKRESALREMERRIVAQFLTCMDEISLENTNGKPVIIIGATNRPDSLDSALRRAGRFDREIGLTVPNENSRASILKVISSVMPLDEELNFQLLAKMTPGFVGADLKALANTAGVMAIKRVFNTTKLSHDSMTIDDENSIELMDAINERNISLDSQILTSQAIPFWKKTLKTFLFSHPEPFSTEELKDLKIKFADFEAALPSVQPSSKREGFTTVPDVSWTDIGALENLQHELQMAIVQPIKQPELYRLVGISAPTGILLCGPPGCGKTLLAKAVANDSRANFISVRGPELINKYVGESEKAVRQIFSRAQASAPCVIFFDEIDALVPKRDEMLSEASSRVVNTFLTELDGLNDRIGVYVIAATNRPDIIDPAMIRPGRLDKALFVDLPKIHEKKIILQKLCRKTKLAQDVNLEEIANDARTDFFSGADLAALVREAAVKALNEYLIDSESIEKDSRSDQIQVSRRHFEISLNSMRPSVSHDERQKYLLLAQRFGISTDESIV